MKWNKEKIQRWSKRALIGVAVVLLLAQFVPVDRTNPPVESWVDAPPDVVAVLERACYDCHSNETTWPAYSRVAPISWLVADHVHEGREAVNYSTWNRYSAEERAELLEETWEEVEEGEMPVKGYSLLHSRARLSDADRSLLRSWAGSVEGAEGSEHEDEDDDEE